MVKESKSEAWRSILHFPTAGIVMQAAHSAIRLQDTDPVTGLAVTISPLYTQHPPTGRFACGISGAVWIGKLAGISRLAAASALAILRLRATDRQQSCKRERRYMA